MYSDLDAAFARHPFLMLSSADKQTFRRMSF